MRVSPLLKAEPFHVSEWVAKIAGGEAKSILPRLSQLKADRVHTTTPGIDYCRALCFLHGEGNLMEARQALLEERRHHTLSTEGADLLYDINEQVKPFLLPPKEIQTAHPTFYLLCDALFDHTMLSWGRLFNLYQSVTVLYEGNTPDSIPAGPIVECGTAGGGSVVLMAVTAMVAEDNFLKQTGHRPPVKEVLSFDTFSGMPEPSPVDRVCRSDGEEVSAASTFWSTGTCSSGEEAIHKLARNFNVDKRLTTVAGKFEQTLPTRQPDFANGIALLHLDADWYDSVRGVLRELTPVLHLPRHISRVQVDDYYYWTGCRKAVDETLLEWRQRGLTVPRLESIDHNAVYMKW
ncbi:hypothetical protein AGDE_06323 [Angomonas deanei]|nr:hypothetical protein AGDE_06323 [Angomonas deanei]|eukprot:EPY37611.1 hypothetical protein AGDE_06323 [Angomonas deanei]